MNRAAVMVLVVATLLGVGWAQTRPTTRPGAPLGKDVDLWTSWAALPEGGGSVEASQVQGRIVAVRAVNVAGEPTPHLLVRIRSDNGATTTVDVGDRLQLPEEGMQRPVTASGRLGQVDGNPVLFADRINLGGQSIAVDRESQGVPWGAKLEGSVQDLREFQVEGDAQPHVLARVQTSRQGMMTVDLGPRQRIPAIRLGDRVQLTGRMGAINGKPVFIADWIAAATAQRQGATTQPTR